MKIDFFKDPDGWDRKNYQYSFFEEKITEDEFLNRVSKSTILLNNNRYTKQND